MPFEKPQAGNPHQLTVNQHCFPASAIARFCDTSGQVQVTLKEGHSFRADPSNKVFCAKRAWDQRAESGYMLSIENEYRDYAESVIASGSLSVSQSGSAVVSAMYSLWCLRESMRDAEIEEYPIPGVVELAVEYSKDDMELLEKAHISTFRPDFTIPARHTVSGLIQIRLNRALRSFRGTEWRLAHAESGFVVPDSSLDRMILPLSPSLCFYHTQEQTMIHGVEDITAFNATSIERCLRYHFSRPSIT